MTIRVHGECGIGLTWNRIGRPRYDPVTRVSAPASMADRIASAAVHSSKKFSYRRRAAEEWNTTRPSPWTTAKLKSVGRTGCWTEINCGTIAATPRTADPSRIGMASDDWIAPVLRELRT